MEHLRSAGVRAVITAIVVSLLATGVVWASHAHQYMDDQAWSSGNWIWWRTGYDWFHNDGNHFKAFAAQGGQPAAGGVFDKMSIYSWAGSSCDNGATWPWASGQNASSPGVTYLEVTTQQVFIPACSSSPKFRSSSSHYWEDGAWFDGKNQGWDQ